MRKALFAILAVVFLLPGCAFAKSITFRNFANTITLSPIAGSIHWLNKRTKGKVANRILVKLMPGVGKDQLRAVDHRIATVIEFELYRLSNGCFCA